MNDLIEAQKGEFQRSRELKILFREQFETWKKRHSGGLEELARRCGVSASYLGHIARYGRIPGKPILMLMALNFEMADPRKLFVASDIADPWPLPEELKLHAARDTEPGFLSMKVDMHGFSSAIREIVRSEMRPRSAGDPSRAGPIRIGFNVNRDCIFSPSLNENPKLLDGFFPQFYKLLAISLRQRSEPEIVSHSDYEQMMEKGHLDMFGPVIPLPERMSASIFTIPFARLGVSALGRKRSAAKILELLQPTSIEDLRRERYEIAVLRDALSHHFARTRLLRSDEDLILCDTPDEALERVVLSGIKRPAHLVIVDSVSAIRTASQHPLDFELLFAEKDTLLGLYDDCIAVRPDWPEVVNVLNETIRFLARQGSIRDLAAKSLGPEFNGVLQFTGADDVR